MPAAPNAPIVRQRLVARLAAARAVVLEAGGGYGKSTLAEQIVAAAGVAAVTLDLGDVGPGPGSVLGALRRAVRAAGLGVLDTALAEVAESEDVDVASLVAAATTAVRDELATRPDPVLLVIDEAGMAAGDGVTAVAAIVEAFLIGPGTGSRAGGPPRVVVGGRAIPPAVIAVMPDAVRVGPAELAFSTDEIEALARGVGRPIDAIAAASIHAATDGWPLAATLAVAAPVPIPASLTAGLDALLATADPALARDAAAVAHLPRLDARIAAAAAGAGTLERLVAAGLPIRQRADGWQELPDPIRAALRGRISLDRTRVQAIAEAYVDAGEPALALAFLLAEDDPRALAASLAGRSWHELTVLDAGELRAALATLPADVIAQHPRVLLAAARVAESGVHLAWRAALLAQVRDLPATQADPVLRREVLAELAADASRSGDEDAAVALASEVLRGAGPGEARSRAVALTALGRAKAFSRDPVAMVAAVEELREAAALLRPLGEPDLLRTTLQVLGYGIHFARGDLDAARDALQEAAAVAPGAIRTRAGVQTFLADVLVASGALDDAEAVLRDVLGVARRLRDHRLLAYHAWMQASIASRRGDAAAVEAWLAEAERHPADWFAHPTGIEFLADGVDHLARVGLHAEARRMLARVEARCAADGREGIDQIALVARALYGARADDPAAAEQDLVACLSIEQVAPREQWRIHLLRGLAAARAGEDATAGRHARRAFEMAAAMGHPDLPQILEADAADRLRGLVAPGAPTAAGVVRVRVLGRFEVTVDGRPVELPDGRPSRLVKLLAVAGRQVPIDEVVDVLWPDADGDLGRQRLRNVLARVRSACGELVVRDEETLGLDPAAEVDLARFEAAARVALRAGEAADEARLRAALARYAGELLPADRYEEFSAAARERVALRHVALLDRLAVVAAARGDVDEALSLVEEAIGAEPLDERRYRTAIDIAVRHGRRDRAIHLVERALAMETELADEPSPELATIAEALGLGGTSVVRRRGILRS